MKWIVVALLSVVGCCPAEVLSRLERCKLVAMPWADGDSFLIETAEGKRLTIRLYGADCLEWHVATESDARRLREQRRYFGISGPAGKAAESVAQAKDFARAAAEETAGALAAPFTVDTSFADARGDGKHPRVYGFVTTAAGEDLAARLVRLGLARAFGVARETPAKASQNEYREHLRDLELQAARFGKGVWAKTDWTALPGERQAQRAEEADLAVATGATGLASGEKIDPNTAARDDLMRLPGVGETMANRIIEGRPYQKAGDLDRVEGIGAATLKRLLPFLEFKPAR